MIIDVSRLLMSDGLSIELEREVDVDRGLFDELGISIDTPVRLSGDIRSAGSMLYLKLDISASYIAECARCLESTAEDISFTINEVFSKPGLENENDDVIILDSNEIDLKDIVEQALSCAMPITSLCSSDCKGLCPICGCNLNFESCDCEEEDIDPRLAVLKDFLK